MKRIFILMVTLLLQAVAIEKVQADPSVPKSNTSKAKTGTKKTVKSVLYKGALYSLDNKHKQGMLYTRSYTKAGKQVFVTTYKIYNAEHKQNVAIVTATHNKAKKTIEVSVRDMAAPGAPVVNVEKTGYETPYMGLFGSGGKVGAIGNATSRGTSPSQLAVKFASKKYDQVKVVSVAGAHEQTNVRLSVYLLDEKI
jgi:hypothetical protein